MRIEHVAIWTQNLELLKEFYVTYFGAQAGFISFLYSTINLPRNMPI